MASRSSFVQQKAPLPRRNKTGNNHYYWSWKENWIRLFSYKNKVKHIKAWKFINGLHASLHGNDVGCRLFFAVLNAKIHKRANNNNNDNNKEDVSMGFGDNLSIETRDSLTIQVIVTPPIPLTPVRPTKTLVTAMILRKNLFSRIKWVRTGCFKHKRKCW